MYGWENDRAVEVARSNVAALIGADPKEIIFTSGATESNNIAVKGVARWEKEKKPHLVTTVLEHKCVLDSFRRMETEGCTVTYLPVQTNGILDVSLLEDLLKSQGDKISLVSVMMVNNEIGVIQPIKEIGALCKKYKVKFHTDAAQAVGKIPVDVNELNVDLLSISAHKMYGPKGIGALYIRRKPRVRVEALMSGGGQERGIRSGTLPAPLCVGLGRAAEVCMEEMENDRRHITELSELLRKTVTSQLEHVFLNGDPEKRWPGNLNLSFAYVEGESLLLGLRDIALSSGSACTSASLEPSYVLRALGVDEELAHTSIRFGIGRFTTKEDILFAAANVIEHVNRLREMSPLWDMVQDGVDLKSIKWSEH